MDAKFSHPGKLLWQVDVPAARVDQTRVGLDRFSDKTPDTCYRYDLALKANEIFWQSIYPGDVFWISITAEYDEIPDYPWGWKTRPWHWMDDAVTFQVQQNTINLGLAPSASIILPIENSDVCNQKASYDMAFALNTDPNYVKWQQPFTGLRDWPHYEDEESMSTWVQASSIAIKWIQQPDLSKTGVDVDATTDIPPTSCPEILADDYSCTNPGPVTEIEVWGSWYQDILPGNDANNATFTLSIRKDIPATANTAGYSMPGAALWSKVFSKGQFSVLKVVSDVQGFASACGPSYSPNNHQTVYKYTFSIDPNQAFVQEGTTEKPVVYWLSVQAELIHAQGTRATRFGWKTSLQAWNDDAVWVQAQEPYNGTWSLLQYPSQHPLHDRHTALAFDIITSSQSSSMITRQVADDWLCTEPTPVVAAAWWGSYIGYTYQACGCNDQTPPVRPDSFLLSIWSDVPKSNPSDPNAFSHPGQPLWQYTVTDFDEVLVGFDKHPEQAGGTAQAHEALFRYSVKIPREKWFYQKEGTHVYWFSVVAVYNVTRAVPYPWGWTNHKHCFNDDAVAGSYVTGVSGDQGWQPLVDQTGASEDMSFILFQQPQTLDPLPQQ